MDKKFLWLSITVVTWVMISLYVSSPIEGETDRLKYEFIVNMDTTHILSQYYPGRLSETDVFCLRKHRNNASGRICLIGKVPFFVVQTVDAITRLKHTVIPCIVVTTQYNQNEWKSKLQRFYLIYLILYLGRFSVFVMAEEANAASESVFHRFGEFRNAALVRAGSHTTPNMG